MVIQLVNATEQDQQFRIGVDNLAGAVISSSDTIEVGATQAR